MTTDENILIEMFERVTNPARDNVDNLAVQMFCMIVQSNSSLVTKSHELIVKKLYSNNITEAVRAIELLEECMSKGGLEFQKKTAKFTFLNKIVTLVLDKHSGTAVPVETKKRLMECLMLWTVEHPDKLKIQDTYDNLNKQVNFTHDSSNSPALANVREQRSSILGKDDQLMAKLLKQGGKENFKKVNLLIQHRVNQETRRTEFICHLKSELRKIESTMEVLNEMLNSYSPDAPEGESGDIIQELYNTCKGHNEQMARWPDFLGDAEPTFLEDVLNTKDLLMVVIQRYKEIFENEKEFSKPTKLNTSLSSNTDLLSELLADTLTTSSQIQPNPTKPTNPIKESDDVDELNEIFGSIVEKADKNEPHHPSNLLCDLDFLEPISVFKTELKDRPAYSVSSVPLTNAKDEKKGHGFKELKEIDKLSEEMFKQSLKNEQRLLSFKKETEKLTLNDLAKDKCQTSLIVSNVTENTIETPSKSNEVYKTLKNVEGLTTDFEENKKESTILKTNNLTTDIKENKKESQKISEDKSNSNEPSLLTLKPLAEIYVDLDNVTPLDEGQRMLLDDDDIQITLNFTADRPSEHVSVIVITVTNKSKLLVKDFLFEASVKKPCKVRLLPPTDVVMAPRKPFRPSTPINQVLLLLNRTQNPVDIICIIGYKLGDDPDLIKESIVARDIPYV